MGRKLEPKKSVEECWEFWKTIVENPDGTINVEQLKKEFADFSMLIDHMQDLYCMATGNRVSYVTTMPQAVYTLFEEQLQESYDSGYADCKEDHGIKEDA